MPKVEFAHVFNRELTRLTRKYPALANEMLVLLDQLEQGEKKGDKIPRTGYDV
jgi:hypothetical protein